MIGMQNKKWVTYTHSPYTENSDTTSTWDTTELTVVRSNSI